MNINKPLSHEIKHNDINFIEKNEQKDQNNGKNDNKREEKVNEDLEETNEDIIENYPYEFYEEVDNEHNDEDKSNNQIKIENNDNANLEQNNMEYITSDYEPQPEPDQQILDISNLNINEIKEKKIKNNNNEDVIDFDEESMIITNDKIERKIINKNINENENENENKNKINKNQIDDKDKNNNNLNKEIIKDKDKEINKEENYNKQITSDKKNENYNKRLLNRNNKDNYSNKENVINYSLDQDEILDILNLNKENECKNSEIVNDDLQKLFINKMNTKKLLEDLYEKEKKFKNAYEEYYSKLSETMNNNYFKNFFESSNISKDFLKQQNDINIFYSNNNNNYINFFNKNDQVVGINNLKNNKSESNLLFNKNKRQNDAYEEYKNSKKIKMMIENNRNSNGYMRHPTIILSIRKFLNEYNNSIQNRAFSDVSKNPLLNYQIFIDILKDLYYIEQNKLSKLIFEDSSLYKNLWDFLITTKSENATNINKEEVRIESNVLLLFILILNGYFSNKKIIDELEIELNWLKFEDYEMLIINNEYIEDNFSNLIEIRKKNYLKKSKLDSSNNKNEGDNDSKGPEDILSEYFNSYTNNANSNTNFNTIANSINTIKKKKFVYSSNNIEDKNDNKEKQINNINKQLYAFKPRNSSNIKKESSKDVKNSSSSKNKSLSTLNMVDVNKLKESNSINTKNNNTNSNNNNNNVLRNTLKLNNNLSKSRSRSKNKTKSKIKKNNIKYNEYNTVSKKSNDSKEIQANSDIKNINNNTIQKKPSNKNISNNLAIKGKSGNYITKVKQNRTDLKKLFKNNEYKDGTLNERLEQIKRQRNKSKSKGAKVQIKYEQYNTNLDNNKEKIEQVQKPKYQFRKHTPQKKNIIMYNFSIDDKEYILEHNVEENIEIEIMQLIQKNNLTGISTKSILEKIKINQKNNSDEIK